MVRAYHVIDPDYFTLGYLLLGAFVVFFVLQLVLLFLAAHFSPLDPNKPGDEREIFIELRASRIAYLVLIALVTIATFPVIHAHGGNWGWGTLYLGAMVIAEMVQFSTQIYYFRRQA